MSEEKCRGCKWYGKPYWSVINPCDNCHRENTTYQLSDKLAKKVIDLQQKVEQLEKENFNIRENIHLERTSLPSELTKDKNFMELYDIPSYEDLKKKVEQLENIRKEAIEYVKQNCQIIRYKDEYGNLIDKIGEVNGYDLLNILNKGSDNE